MVAGVFLILYGLSMLDLRGRRVFGIPAPAFLSRFVSKQSHHYRSPLAFGLLNGPHDCVRAAAGDLRDGGGFRKRTGGRQVSVRIRARDAAGLCSDSALRQASSRPDPHEGSSLPPGVVVMALESS